MATAAAPIGEAKPPARRKERVRRHSPGPKVENGARYFLVKSSGADKMELGEEAVTENDAMVTAFRTGSTFAVVTEWKTTVDLTGGKPIIKKEVIGRKRD